MSSLFLNIKEEQLPPDPKAIFTSNPLSSLVWLVDRWKEIHKAVPEAELHVFTGPAPYGKWGKSVAEKMQVAISYAAENRDAGVVVHEPVSKNEWIAKIKQSRVMLYRGDIAETFCLSIAETLELGIPCVTMDIGSMKERIQNGKTGYVMQQDKDFVSHAIAVLRDDQEWLRLHNLESRIADDDFI